MTTVVPTFLDGLNFGKIPSLHFGVNVLTTLAPLF